MPRDIRCLSCRGDCITFLRNCEECQWRVIREQAEELHLVERWAILCSGVREFLRPGPLQILRLLRALPGPRDLG